MEDTAPTPVEGDLPPLDDREMGSGGVTLAFFATLAASTVVAAIALSIAAGGSLSDSNDNTRLTALATAWTASWVVWTVGSILIARFFGSGSVRDSLGLNVRLIDLAGLVFGAATQLVVVPAIYLPLRQLWPSTFSTEALTRTARDIADRGELLPNVIVACFVVIGAPLVEELLYRGALQRQLLRRNSAVFVVPAVAMLFAIVHFRPVELPGLFVAGLVFGICAWRTDRLAMAIAAHVGFNGVGLLMVFW